MLLFPHATYDVIPVTITDVATLKQWLGASRPTGADTLDILMKNVKGLSYYPGGLRPITPKTVFVHVEAGKVKDTSIRVSSAALTSTKKQTVRSPSALGVITKATAALTAYAQVQLMQHSRNHYGSKLPQASQQKHQSILTQLLAQADWMWWIPDSALDASDGAVWLPAGYYQDLAVDSSRSAPFVDNFYELAAKLFPGGYPAGAVKDVLNSELGIESEVTENSHAWFTLAEPRIINATKAEFADTVLNAGKYYNVVRQAMEGTSEIGVAHCVNVSSTMVDIFARYGVDRLYHRSHDVRYTCPDGVPQFLYEQLLQGSISMSCSSADVFHLVVKSPLEWTDSDINLARDRISDLVSDIPVDQICNALDRLPNRAAISADLELAHGLFQIHPGSVVGLSDASSDTVQVELPHRMTNGSYVGFATYPTDRIVRVQ